MTTAQIARKSKSIEKKLLALFEEANAIIEAAPDDDVARLASNLSQALASAADAAQDITSWLTSPDW